MNGIEFPPSERVNLFGNFTRGELAGAAAATAVFGVGVMSGLLVPAVAIAAALVVWTFTPTRRLPFRVIVPAALRWTLRRDRTWSAPMRGAPSMPTFLRGTQVRLTNGEDGEPPAEHLLIETEQVVAPGDRAAERLLSLGPVASAAGQQREPVSQTG